MPAPIVALTREMLHNPATINLERKPAPAVGHHAGGLSGAAGAEVGAPAVALLKRGDMQRRARLHAHQAPRQPPRASTWSRHGVDARAHPRQPLAGAAHRGARRLQERQVPRAGGHRHRRARHRRRGARPRGELRRARRCPRTTSTAWAARRAPRRPARRSPSSRRRRRATCGAIERAIGKRLPRVTVPDFDYNASAEPSASRSRWPSASRRCAPPASRDGPAQPRKPSRATAPRDTAGLEARARLRRATAPLAPRTALRVPADLAGRVTRRQPTAARALRRRALVARRDTRAGGGAGGSDPAAPTTRRSPRLCQLRTCRLSAGPNRRLPAEGMARPSRRALSC